MDEKSPSTSRGEQSFYIDVTRRGRELLRRAGYEYILKRINKDGSKLWRCARKNVCNATVKIRVDAMTILNETAHCHEPIDLAKYKVNRQMQKCVEDVQKDINIPVAQVFENNMEVLKDEGLQHVTQLPHFHNIEKRLYKKRNDGIGAKKVTFHKAADVEVPKKYQNLLLADYREQKKRVIVFASEEIKKYFKLCKHFYIDGTFKICIKSFYQLYTIHADVGSNEDYVNVVPVAYALLPDKKESTYKLLFELIKSQIPEWEPAVMTMDFEVASIQAVKHIFPGVKILGCFYHFKKSLWRKAKELGVNKTQPGKDHVQLCSALSHLPLDMVDDGWLYVMEESPISAEITNFNDYFVQTWLENSTLAGTFTTYGELNKTNNAVEQWNSHIRKYIKPKPNIAQLLEGLIKDMKYYSGVLKNPNGIQISKRKYSSIAKMKKIYNSVTDLLNCKISIGHFLERLR